MCGWVRVCGCVCVRVCGCVFLDMCVCVWMCVSKDIFFYSLFFPPKGRGQCFIDRNSLGRIHTNYNWTLWILLRTTYVLTLLILSRGDQFKHVCFRGSQTWNMCDGERKQPRFYLPYLFTQTFTLIIHNDPPPPAFSLIRYIKGPSGMMEGWWSFWRRQSP